MLIKVMELDVLGAALETGCGAFASLRRVASHAEAGAIALLSVIGQRTDDEYS